MIVLKAETLPKVTRSTLLGSAGGRDAHRPCLLRATEVPLLTFQSCVTLHVSTRRDPTVQLLSPPARTQAAASQSIDDSNCSSPYMFHTAPRRRASLQDPPCTAKRCGLAVLALGTVASVVVMAKAGRDVYGAKA